MSYTWEFASGGTQSSGAKPDRHGCICQRVVILPLHEMVKPFTKSKNDWQRVDLLFNATALSCFATVTAFSFDNLDVSDN